MKKQPTDSDSVYRWRKREGTGEEIQDAFCSVKILMPSKAVPPQIRGPAGKAGVGTIQIKFIVKTYIQYQVRGSRELEMILEDHKGGQSYIRTVDYKRTRQIWHGACS